MTVFKSKIGVAREHVHWTLVPELAVAGKVLFAPPAHQKFTSTPRATQSKPQHLCVLKAFPRHRSFAIKKIIGEPHPSVIVSYIRPHYGLIATNQHRHPAVYARPNTSTSGRILTQSSTPRPNIQYLSRVGARRQRQSDTFTAA